MRLERRDRLETDCHVAALLAMTRWGVPARGGDMSPPYRRKTGVPARGAPSGRALRRYIRSACTRRGHVPALQSGNGSACSGRQTAATTNELHTKKGTEHGERGQGTGAAGEGSGGGDPDVLREERVQREGHHADLRRVEHDGEPAEAKGEGAGGKGKHSVLE